MKTLRLGVFSLMVLGLSASAYADSSDSAPVTQGQFKQWTDWMKKSVNVLDQRERKIEQSGSAGTNTDSGSVDLNQLQDTPQGASNTSQTTFHGPSGPGGGATPLFTTYFDLNFINQPGTNDSLAFDNYHTFLFFDITPTPDLQFSFNLLGPTTLPIFYELDYQATPRLTLRAGKIWIPFDDLSPHSPHNIFGGRVGLQQLQPTTTSNGGALFLPSVWTELGVGAKYLLVDERNFQLETHLCIVNGFTDGGTDPDPNDTSTDYPNFAGAGYSPLTQNSSGNHRRKSVAARVHTLLYNTYGIGASYYGGQWNQDGDPATNGSPLYLTMLGLDAQARFSRFELRGGVATMSVELPSATMSRGGSYVEAGVPFLTKWKALARMGTLQLDNRVLLPTDEEIIGGTMLYNPTGAVQFSLEYSRDIKDPGVSVGFRSYTDLRMVMVF